MLTNLKLIYEDDKGFIVAGGLVVFICVTSVFVHTVASSNILILSSRLFSLDTDIMLLSC